MWTDFIEYFRALAARVATAQSGQTLVEYALIIALVSVALAAALMALAGPSGLAGEFTNITNAL